MPKGITFIKALKKSSPNLKKAQPITVYRLCDGERQLIGHFDSLNHAAEKLHCNTRTVSKYLDLSVPYNGMEFYRRGADPYAASAGVSREIEEEDDLPVIAFFKDDDTPIARYKSVTFLHKCIGRSIKQILEWLKGGHCTDPDCYYKYERDCTEQEIAAVNNKSNVKF